MKFINLTYSIKPSIVIRKLCPSASTFNLRLGGTFFETEHVAFSCDIDRIIKIRIEMGYLDAGLKNIRAALYKNKLPLIMNDEEPLSLLVVEKWNSITKKDVEILRLNGFIYKDGVYKYCTA